MKGHPVSLNRDAWPVLVITPAHDFLTDGEYEAFLADYQEVTSERAGAFVTVLDLRDSKGLTPVQRQRLTAESFGGRATGGGRCVGFGMVFTSTLMRGFLTAIFWVARPPYATEVFADLEAAVEWGKQTVYHDAARA
jgi:hypothetical protein